MNILSWLLSCRRKTENNFGISWAVHHRCEVLMGDYLSDRFWPFSAGHASIACYRCEKIMVCPTRRCRPKADIGVAFTKPFWNDFSIRISSNTGKYLLIAFVA